MMVVRCGREATLRKKGNPKQSNRSGSLSRCLNLGLSRAAGVGGWGAARPAQLCDFRACPLRIQLPLGVAKTIRSYHHLRASSYQSASDIRRAKRNAKVQKRAARRAGGKDDTLAGGPRFSPRREQFRLPCRPDLGNTHCRSSRRAQQLRQLGEVRRHPPRFVSGQSIGDGAPDSAKPLGDLQRLELGPGMAPRCSLHGCCRMNPVRAICRDCRRLL